ncbi:AAA family ATPase [Paenibacillus sp. GSMTC-2017]|nr:AAA family ATPase [Paenibacillus sp. GSMTC-2017]
MSYFIKQITIEHYRGLKNKQVLLLAKKNHATFIVGPNNSGKSLLARIVRIFQYSLDGQLKNTKKFAAEKITDNDYYNLDTNRPIVIEFTINNSTLTQYQDPKLNKLVKFKETEIVIQIHKSGKLYLGNICIAINGIRSHEVTNTNQYLDVVFNPEFLNGFGINGEEVEKICNVLYNILQDSILVFDPIRAFDRAGDDSLTVSGYELVNWLNETEHLSEKRTAKDKVKQYIEKQLHLDAPVAVSSNVKQKELIFTFSGNMELSSKEVGTGYTMLYILLMELVRNRKMLIIIDEIESHLQPGLVREVMKVIKQIGSAQFIISTHSPVAIETATEEDYLYRSQKIEGVCSFSGFFKHVGSDPSGARIAREICNELGVLPGDVLLSNCIIWVEGPSEVFWLRTWIKTYCEYLISQGKLSSYLLEGLHYSLLMTGGSTISHYSFEEEIISLNDIEEDTLLKVLKVNPNPFVMIDSDRTNVGSQKYKRFIRIAKELNRQNRTHYLLRDSVVDNEADIESEIDKIPNLWILTGRELENYTHPELMKNFYSQREKHPASKIKGTSLVVDWDVYSNSEGAGRILENRGLIGVSAESGTIKHKDELARYIYNNFEVKHLLKQSIIPQPNFAMIDDLTKGLDKIIAYIKKVNYL